MTQQNNQALTTPREETGKFVTTLRSPEYREKFGAMLPADVPVDRFVNIVIRAVQEDPDLMKPTTDKASLFLACQRAAADGLIPDKREGALVMYGNKVQWQVMIGGLRKILAKHGFDIRADVVYEHDTFDYDLGDDPRITHKAPPFGTKRGNIIGAYAIARGPDGKVYREVMDKEAIDYVRSNAKSGSVWQKWYGEMAKKTVARRLTKSLPLYSESDQLRDVIERDNENFDLGSAKQTAPSAAASAVQDAVRGKGKAKPAPEPEPEGEGPGREVIEGDFTEVEGEDEGEGQPQVDDPGF